MHETVILGGGIAGLTTAYALAKRGILSTVIEARMSLGGLAAGGSIAGVRIDLGAESFTLRSTKILELCAELGVEVRYPHGSSWVWDDGVASPIAHGIWGIPSSWDDPAFTVLSAEELDTARKLDSTVSSYGSQAHTLAELVRVRLGQAVLTKMVEPVAGAIHGISPEKLDLDAVAPGLREALLHEGSLIKAVHSQRGEEQASIVQPVGGINALVDALSAQLQAMGTSIVTGHMAIDLMYDDSAASSQTSTPVSSSTGSSSPSASDSPAPFGILLARSDGDKKNPQPCPGTEEVVFAKRLVVALDGPHARALVAPVLPTPPTGVDYEWTIPHSDPISTAILAIDDERLDPAPLGSGVLVKPGSSLPVKALTHYSMKWPWAAQELARAHGGKHVHLLRLSYGRPGEPSPSPTIDQALQDASALFGVAIKRHALIEGRIIEWGPSLIAHSPEHKKNVQSFLRSVDDVLGLAVTGAWVAGTGLGSVIPHAYKIGENID
ncbi:protoporphyrinogen/coproporphyrinogen oxidase [Arcanobacterium bovis]|uniref:FAD-dependent oxidoreductase n=1 Tax=Arcanobacterium bovis TaxID=2529275 RepID=A0A4Q9V0C3_9ACTO|nr:FAD-dependent oxidoreductase [Arcanobacterium bovis]TBW22097.1 FAD-dependent oxidoreductase [Arcanobacterium bovis]